MTAFHNIHLRRVENETINRLKYEAKTKKISVNQLILTLLNRSLGLSHKPSKTIYHDLDYLAGTWSKKQSDEFLESISDFEKIDKGIWK